MRDRARAEFKELGQLPPRSRKPRLFLPPTTIGLNLDIKAPLPRIAVVIPCYKVRDSVIDVIARMPAQVSDIVCVDDACTENSGLHVERHVHDPRVRVIYHDHNRGVGGAMKTGYFAARDAGALIAVKIDGDGQMDPALINDFISPIIAGEADYTKGNRFFFPEDARGMPAIRLFSNAVLGFIAKLSTGYWPLFDPTNGYTALHLDLLEILNIRLVSDGYFFETDLLFRLNIARCVVKDVPMKAVYGAVKSNLKVSKVFLPFLVGNLQNLVKRIFYNYFLRDFQVASLEILIGPPLLIFGVTFGVWNWWTAFSRHMPADIGSAALPTLLIILGVQFCLSALHFDIRNVPVNPVHKWFGRRSGSAKSGGANAGHLEIVSSRRTSR